MSDHTDDVQTIDAEIVLDENEARELTAQIQRAWIGIAERIEATRGLIIQAYHGRAWSLLGYESWADYCKAEFALGQFKIPRETRYALVADLRQMGQMSTRNIAAVVGTDQKTVRRDLAASTEAHAAVATVVDANGKRHHATRDHKPGRERTGLPKPKPTIHDAALGFAMQQILAYIDTMPPAQLAKQLDRFTDEDKAPWDAVDGHFASLQRWWNDVKAHRGQ